MGSFSGPITFTTYYVPDGHKLPDDFRESFIAALNHHAFKPVDVDQDREEAMGWVTTEDPSRATFELNAVLWGSYVLFSLRHDQIRVSPTLLKMQVATEAASFLTKTGREKLSKGELAEIKERVERALKKRALPRVAVYDVIWSLDDRVVRVWTATRKVLDQFADLFQETFDVELHEKCPYAELERLGVDEIDALTEIEPARLAEPPEGTGSQGAR